MLNRIEIAVTHAADDVTPLERTSTTIPVATPFVVAGVVGGAFLAGAAVGCAEGRCAQDPGGMAGASGVAAMAVGDLLQSRREAL